MTKEQKATLSQKEQDEIYALDVLSEICYTTKVNIAMLQTVRKRMRMGPIWDLSLHFEQNQQNWLNKVRTGLRQMGIKHGINLLEGMDKDLNDQAIDYLFGIVMNLKQCQDLVALDDMVEACVG